MEYTEDGIVGLIEPMCKIRFLSDPKPDEEYVAVPVSEMIDLIADQMRLMALDGGGVDNWSAYGWAIEDYLEECRHSYCYDMNKLREYALMNKASDETVEEYIEDMGFNEFASFEVWTM